MPELGEEMRLGYWHKIYPLHLEASDDICWHVLCRCSPSSAVSRCISEYGVLPLASHKLLFL